jgi:hypothetical protein
MISLEFQHPPQPLGHRRWLSTRPRPRQVVRKLAAVSAGCVVARVVLTNAGGHGSRALALSRSLFGLDPIAPRRLGVGSTWDSCREGDAPDGGVYVRG